MNNHSWQQAGPYWSYPGYYHVNRTVTMEEAMRIARERVPGEVIKVELDRENGLYVYEVKIRTADGVVYELEIDVHTGQIVKLKID